MMQNPMKPLKAIAALEQIWHLRWRELYTWGAFSRGFREWELAFEVQPHVDGGHADRVDGDVAL
jgi:hypothetical protein